MASMLKGLILSAAIAWGATWLAPEASLSLEAAQSGRVIEGVVRSPKGPEAGVWVIAETHDLPTRFRKIVVTDDQGRYVLPELPNAAFKVWVRGYGLIDSSPVSATPNRPLNLSVDLARSPQEAAIVYPASYWASLIEPPAPSEFPGTGVDGNGISPTLKAQDEFVNIIKACQRCHQLGTKATRVIPDRDQYASAEAAWDHRVTMGQRGGEMSAFMTRMGRPRGLKMFADWTNRIADGDVPPAPPRPHGIERNVVITMWGWNDGYGLVHDEIATDRRDPRRNAYGRIYAVDWTNDWFMWVDPLEHASDRAKVPHGTASTKLRQAGFTPFRLFGERPVWENPASPHNPMMDAKGRVWITTASRRPPTPDWCRSGSDNRFAKYHPIDTSGQQAGFYDPKTRTFTLIDTCFGTHHLQFAEDADDTLVFSNPGGEEIGWINTRLYDRTGDEKAAQGWCPTVLDTNGDGQITRPWNEPAKGNAAIGDEDSETARLGGFDPKLDTRIRVGAYGVIVNPVDGSIWGSTDEVEVPGQIFRIDRGANPPETCRTERYMVPRERGYRPRGIDVDRNGVIWTALAGSAHLASFDRRKCKVLGGVETVRGRHCDEGWTFYKQPGPLYRGTTTGTEFNYYNWVDQFDTLGLGPNTPLANGSSSDSLLALNPASKEWIVMRVPYPLGFHSRGMDGRVDDPKAGWKGRGVYSTFGADAAWHIEGGLSEGNNLVKFQIRPSPLAR